jgi:adenylate cyclase
MPKPARILVVDDVEDNREIARVLLSSHGYDVETAPDGLAAIERINENPPDLVLLDLMMPGIDGFETLRRIKANDRLPFIPIIMLTAKSGVADMVLGLESGADDYATKPIEESSLLARVKASLRIKSLQDEVTEQAERLADWNKTLEERVASQVVDLERMQSLKRFLAPQVAEAILASPDGSTGLESHRREVAILISDFRGFTAFAETAEPEDVIKVLREYHETAGEIIFRNGGTLERIAGDAIVVVFNDPVTRQSYCSDAAQVALDILSDCQSLIEKWKRQGAELGIGIGIAAGYATLGEIGWHGRREYTVIGTAANLASRMSDAAKGGQILVNARLVEQIEESHRTNFLGEMEFKGFARPVPVHELTSS